MSANRAFAVFGVLILASRNGSLAKMSIAGTNAAGGAWPHAMSGASPPMPPQQKMTNLYNAIDSNGSGTVTQTQFTQAFQTMNPPAAFQKAGVSAVWNALDPKGTGAVSQQDFVNGMKNQMAQLRQTTDATAGVSQTSATATQSLYNLLA
jgi:hypothetical protein